jgi:hypothetical protein
VITFALFDALGLPLLGAAPSFLVYASEPGTPRAAPPIVEVGAGVYGFTPSTLDEEAGAAFLIDGGEAATPQYYSGALGARVAFGFFAGDGSPWGGAAPTFTRYRGADGVDRPAPELHAFGHGLFGFVPTSDDRRAGTSYVVTAAPDAEPASYAGILPAALPLVSQGARAHDLTIERGTTWVHEFPAALVSLEGTDLEMQIRDVHSPYGRILAEPALVLAADGVTVRASLTAAKTRAIGPRSGVYDLRATDGETVARIFEGNVSVRPDVTR